jgi:hypothetical protein
MTTFDEAWLADYQARRAAEGRGAAINPPGTRFIDRNNDLHPAGEGPKSTAGATPQAGRGPEGSPHQFKAEAKAKRKRPEQDLQKAAVKLLDAALPPYWRVVHVPNGGWRSPIEAAILKGMGVRDGFPDLLLMGRGHKAGRFVVIELKAKGRRGQLSEAQEEWRDWFFAIGAEWYFAESIDQVMAACEDAGIQLRVRAA